MRWRESYGDCLIADETDRNVRLRLDRMAFELITTISPMPHSSHRRTSERAVAAQDVNFSYDAVSADHCFQADLSR